MRIGTKQNFLSIVLRPGPYSSCFNPHCYLILGWEPKCGARIRVGRAFDPDTAFMGVKVFQGPIRQLRAKFKAMRAQRSFEAAWKRENGIPTKHCDLSFAGAKLAIFTFPDGRRTLYWKLPFRKMVQRKYPAAT